jgi:asparagine synthase (glutamine-hydrolysing)
VCGVFFASSPPGSFFPVADVLDVVRHRGPDDTGVFVSSDHSCHLGHVRLSILDLSQSGHQPMVDASERFVISYNGEIYNYSELKTYLEGQYSGINWKSSSDTEVIVEGFALEGVSFLSRLNGIFALGIFDRLENSLHVLRDPLGIKPLFFSEQNGSVIFCSELKGLLAVPGVQRTLRLQSLADQVAYMYVPEPHTPYVEFEKFEPGLCKSYIAGKQVASAKLFEQLQSPMDFASDEDIVARFSQVFSDAVARQLVADVPMSLMLSGGLDSSAVAVEAVRRGGNIRDAYTISFSAKDRFNDLQSDDLSFARLMASRLGLELHVIEAHRDFISMLPELAGFMEDGISDPAAINTYLICKAARKSGVKVMLNGQGADEFLGGYRRYSAERMLRGLPGPARSLSRLAGSALPNHVPGRMNAINRRLKKLLTLGGQERDERMLGMYTWGAKDRISRLFVDSASVSVGGDLLSRLHAMDDHDVIANMMNLDQHYDLMSLNLAYTDRMSMASGVEARVPFLDFELVRLMNSIPASVKMKKGMPKYVLKKAMESLLPHEVIYREKAGFGLPLRSWMRGSNEMMRYYFDEARISRQGIFNASELTQLQNENLMGVDHSSVLFSLLCIQVWLESVHQ